MWGYNELDTTLRLKSLKLEAFTKATLIWTGPIYH